MGAITVRKALHDDDRLIRFPLRPAGKLLSSARTASTTQSNTSLLMSELVEHGYDSERGRASLRTVNRLHAQYDIDRDDMLYVLSTFAFDPLDWIDRYGWRRLHPHERRAAVEFYGPNRCALTALPLQPPALQPACRACCLTPPGIPVCEPCKSNRRADAWSHPRSALWLGPLSEGSVPSYLNGEYPGGESSRPIWLAMQLNADPPPPAS